ncbi:Rad1/Rec1/Rad17 [Cladochytrium replicatum]|nr:Rad1/Rec1/Rad17 [Cladochytrium replicatum]
MGRDVLVARIDSVRPVVSVLKALAYRDGLKAACIVGPNGIKLSVEESRSMQAHGYLQASMFQEYRVATGTRRQRAGPGGEAGAGGDGFAPSGAGRRSDEGGDAGGGDGDEEEEDLGPVRFAVDLTLLLDCLTIFGGPSAVPYGSASSSLGGGSKSGAPTALRVQLTRELELILVLEDNGVVTVARIATYDPSEISDIDSEFQHGAILYSVILNSEWLRDAFSEFDSSTEMIHIHVSSNHPYFRLSSASAVGELQIDYPKDTDVFESFRCDGTHKMRYYFSFFAHSFKALQFSTKTSLRANENGLLSLQYMIPTGDSTVSFVEFLLTPVVDDEEDELENDEETNHRG